MYLTSLGRLKQRDHKFKVSLGYVTIFYGIFFIAFLQLHPISLSLYVIAKFDCQLDLINRHLNQSWTFQERINQGGNIHPEWEAPSHVPRALMEWKVGKEKAK